MVRTLPRLSSGPLQIAFRNWWGPPLPLDLSRKTHAKVRFFPEMAMGIRNYGLKTIRIRIMPIMGDMRSWAKVVMPPKGTSDMR